MRGALQTRPRFSQLANEIQQQGSHEWLLNWFIGINKYFPQLMFNFFPLTLMQFQYIVLWRLGCTSFLVKVESVYNFEKDGQALAYT